MKGVKLQFNARSAKPLLTSYSCTKLLCIYFSVGKQAVVQNSFSLSYKLYIRDSKMPWKLQVINFKRKLQVNLESSLPEERFFQREIEAGCFQPF